MAEPTLYRAVPVWGGRFILVGLGALAMGNLVFPSADLAHAALIESARSHGLNSVLERDFAGDVLGVYLWPRSAGAPH